MKDALNLIWIDLEMTGLSPEHDRIIEIATVVTDKDLNVLGEGPVYAVSQPRAMLDGMENQGSPPVCKTPPQRKSKQKQEPLSF